ncbi:hypothetical protein FOMG_17503 [Fusarium oxysporum f. sp. melonis 26406]|uniref:Uncharacterized protein n=1 Tax=Fusarium oxysporum f. sp. melonis 26406 TaxID=1089452 RepID=W9Z270_FUSOX|nr:hypothetical protein FOMG_17503 [Fusarium oxysporum f. sp. melonis 26406]
MRIRFAALARTPFAGYLARGCKAVESPPLLLWQRKITSDATVHDDRRTCATESEEDEEGGNANVEDWDPDEDDDNDDDSEDDDSEDENNCNNSGY